MNHTLINKQILEKKKFLRTIHTPEIKKLIIEWEHEKTAPLLRAQQTIETLMKDHPKDLYLEKQNILKEIKKYLIL